VLLLYLQMCKCFGIESNRRSRTKILVALAFFLLATASTTLGVQALVFPIPPVQSTATTLSPTHIIFPGGGVYFYWQAGAVTFLRETYNLSSARFTGASAGALTAALTCNDVDFNKATKRALELANDAGIWDRGSLQGIWGELIREWLDELLPDNAAERATQRQLALLVTPVPFLGKEKISDFANKKDLIDCAMASAHLPWFLNGKLTTKFRNRRYIDGSFLASRNDYQDVNDDANAIVLDYKKDLAYKNKGLFEFVKAASPDGIYRMIEDGYNYAQGQDQLGAYETLLPRR
jgi:predicted patatin/cPLA2 family phospholipase